MSWFEVLRVPSVGHVTPVRDVRTTEEQEATS